MNSRRYIAAVWLLFVVRGLFYAIVLPLWEGFDEWSHFAYVQRVALNGDLLVDRSTRISQDIDQTFSVVPLPWVLRGIRPTSLAHDEWWRLPDSERAGRQQQLLCMPRQWALTPAPRGEPIYEALQPPLYYWIAGGALVLGPESLVDRVFALRILNVLIASALIPIAFFAVRRTTGDAMVAACGVALLAVMPELCIDIARVSNEALSIVLFSMVVLAGFYWDASYRSACLLGAALGLGLLTKAYFLIAVPAVIVLLAMRARRRALIAGVIVFGLAACISGWWYVRNWLTTGTWTGLTEAMETRGISPTAFLTAARDADWRNAIDSILVSHLWFGGWSALTVRSWIYHVLFALGALAAVGVVVRIVRSRKVPVGTAMVYMAAVYVLFWLGEAYNVVLIYLAKHTSTSMGWYLYAVSVPEVALATWGLAALVPRLHLRGMLTTVIVLFAVLDLYGMHFLLLPYYNGYLSHRPNGTLEAFHLSQVASTYLAGLFARLSVNRPTGVIPGVTIALWAMYVGATVALVILPLKIAGCVEARNADSLEGKPTCA